MKYLNLFITIFLISLIVIAGTQLVNPIETTELSLRDVSISVNNKIIGGVILDNNGNKTMLKVNDSEAIFMGAAPIYLFGLNATNSLAEIIQTYFDFILESQGYEISNSTVDWVKLEIGYNIITNYNYDEVYTTNYVVESGVTNEVIEMDLIINSNNFTVATNNYQYYK
jgi:hypothetical protein